MLRFAFGACKIAYFLCRFGQGFVIRTALILRQCLLMVLSGMFPESQADAELTWFDGPELMITGGATHQAPRPSEELTQMQRALGTATASIDLRGRGPLITLRLQLLSLYQMQIL